MQDIWGDTRSAKNRATKLGDVRFRVSADRDAHSVTHDHHKVEDEWRYVKHIAWFEYHFHRTDVGELCSIQCHSFVGE